MRGLRDDAMTPATEGLLNADLHLVEWVITEDGRSVRCSSPTREGALLLHSQPAARRNAHQDPHVTILAVDSSRLVWARSLLKGSIASPARYCAPGTANACGAISRA
jgi:hypothetical protein